ncbi:N-acetylmuramoyl-L-alanine amidase [Kurthia zopfii]|nr:N-acetylmuramoyl-L-alanine amidase [Kurthia zopfii]
MKRLSTRKGEIQKMKVAFKWALPFVMLIIATFSMHSMNATAATNDDVTEELAPANPDSKSKWEGKPFVTDLTKPQPKMLRASANDPVVVDISHHQGNINWSQFSKAADLAIIRTQYGSVLEDRQHKTYESQATKYGVPYGVYAYFLATDEADAKVEARDFYKRAGKDAKFYVVDVEEDTSTEKNPKRMRAITSSFIAELRKLTDKKIGIYVGHHTYNQFNLDMSKADFVWIPRYGNLKPAFKHDIWQYTDKGRIAGVPGYVDLNKLVGTKELSFYTKDVQKPVEPSKPKYYTTNPKKVAIKKAVANYDSTTFNDNTKIGRYDRNEIVEVEKIVLTKSGTPRLKLDDGTYITSNMDYVVKTRSNIEDYTTVVPKKVILQTTQSAYKSTNFVAKNKLATYSPNTIFTISDIKYTSKGTPVLKTISGYYISALKTNTRKVVNNVTDYLYINPKKIVTTSKVNEYTTVSFKEKTGTAYAKGKTLTVTGVRWSSNGTPRLKLGSGKYITANKKYVKIK